MDYNQSRASALLPAYFTLSTTSSCSFELCFVTHREKNCSCCYLVLLIKHAIKYVYPILLETGKFQICLLCSEMFDSSVCDLFHGVQLWLYRTENKWKCFLRHAYGNLIHDCSVFFLLCLFPTFFLVNYNRNEFLNILLMQYSNIRGRSLMCSSYNVYT